MRLTAAHHIRPPSGYQTLWWVEQVADFHRTLLLGGVAMNPRSHLRLVYEANPLAFLAEQAGGRVCFATSTDLDRPAPWSLLLWHR